MTLAERVQQYIEFQVDGAPIFIDDIVRALKEEMGEDEKKLRQNVTVTCSRLLTKLDGFSRFDVGIYYYTTRPDGDINRKELTRQLYIENKRGDVYGSLICGSLAFHHGLTDEQPEHKQIMTNNWRRAPKCSEEEGLKLVAPYEEITPKNVRYFEILELIKWDPTFVDEEKTRSKLIELISRYELQSIRLMSFAVSHYNQKVVLALAKLAPFYLQEMHEISSKDSYTVR
ncbi:hypothetical protein [Atopococcus tabaci]|uniref:hypothetical protein n=1 Tax=Atopococcus tabaci TaxID=269774 RepID=UPI0004237360|nr:hypothetical protein [Atopococcus tabaci]